MSKNSNIFSHVFLPILLVVALLFTQVSLQYYLLDNDNTVMMAEEENEVNSRPLLEEIHFLIDFSLSRAIKSNTQNSNFPEYFSKLYQNPNLSIFSPPPDVLINI